MSNTERSIGDYLQEIALDEESQLRIAKAIKEEKLPLSVLKEYAAETKTFKVITKKLKVKGFRQKTPGYNKRALSQLISDLSEGGRGRNSKLLWTLYLDSAVDYIVNQLPNLNKLLDQVMYGSQFIEEAMNLICEYSYYYEVSKEDIRVLYEIWHIPRLDNFEDTLNKCDSGSLVLKGIFERTLALEEKIEDIKRSKNEKTISPIEIERKETQVIDADLIAKNIEGHTSRLIEEKILKLEEKLNNKSESKTNLNEQEFSKILDELRSEIKSLEQNIKSEYEQHNDSIDLLKNNITENKNNNTLLNGKVSQEIEGIKESVKKEIDEQIGVIKGNIMQIAQESLYVSPLSKIKKKNKEPKYKITSISQFLESWSKNIDQTNYTVTKEQLLVQHQIYTQNPIIIVEDEAVLEGWLETLSWKPFCKTESVSPMWLRESDWKAGAEFLFEFDKDQPKFLKFKNFDFGLIDSYLLPSLELWLENVRSPLKKVFLIPSQGEVILSPKMSTLVSYENDMRDTLPVLRSNSAVNSKPIFSKEAIGLSPKTFIKWSEEKVSVDINLQPILNATSITLPLYLKDRFLAVAESLNYHLKTRDSVIIAAKTSIIPWITSAYDESVAMDFLELLEASC